jgi:hypothetical protein
VARELGAHPGAGLDALLAVHALGVGKFENTELQTQ